MLWPWPIAICCIKMISAVKGKIFQIKPGEVDLDTGQGLVFHVLCPVSSYMELKSQDEVLLYTVLRQKDEESILYGFLSEKEKRFFEKLISISGVGGKTALSFISAFSVAELGQAIETGDVDKLSSIPGIGKKTAQRIILELTGKVEFFEEEQTDGRINLKEDLVSGLVNLGFTHKGASQCVDDVLKKNPEASSFEILFKEALKKLRNR